MLQDLVEVHLARNQLLISNDGHLWRFSTPNENEDGRVENGKHMGKSLLGCRRCTNEIKHNLSVNEH